MSMTIKRAVQLSTKKVILRKVADIPNGVGVKTSDLGGDVINEGALLSAPVEGLASVIKTAVVATAATDSATDYEVAQGHNFKVGDFVTTAEKKKASAISAIVSVGSGKDKITLAATLGEAVTVGASLYQAKAATATNSSALVAVPQSIVGTSTRFAAGDNVYVDAVVIGITKGASIPAGYLPGIINL